MAYEGLSDAVALADSGTHRCVVHRDGGVSCWGDNHHGQSSTSSELVLTHPTRVAGIHGADRIAVASGFSRAGTVAAGWTCWGENTYFTLAFGPGATAPRTPFDVPGLAGADMVAIGQANAAALFGDGHVEAISIPDSRVAHPYTLAGIDDAIDVTAFSTYVCVVRASGHVWCAGEPMVAVDPPPYEVPGIADARAFADGDPTFYEACAVTSGGAIQCWTLARSPAPWLVPTTVGVGIASFSGHMCAATCAGGVVCNGPGWRGENGDDTNRVPPTEISLQRRPPTRCRSGTREARNGSCASSRLPAPLPARRAASGVGVMRRRHLERSTTSPRTGARALSSAAEVTMEQWKLGAVVGVMTLGGVVVGAQCFGSRPVSAQASGYRECFFGRQESVDINNEAVVEHPNRDRMIIVPAGFEVVGGGGASTMSNGNANDATILFCRR